MAPFSPPSHPDAWQSANLFGGGFEALEVVKDRGEGYIEPECYQRSYYISLCWEWGYHLGFSWEILVLWSMLVDIASEYLDSPLGVPHGQQWEYPVLALAVLP
eukprot:Gb_06180 [translate_table: standard]